MCLVVIVQGCLALQSCPRPVGGVNFSELNQVNAVRLWHAGALQLACELMKREPILSTSV